MARLVVFASGAGSTFKAILAAVQSRELEVESIRLVTSRPDTGAEEIARGANLDVRIFNPKDFLSAEIWDEAQAAQIREWQPDLVVLAGYTLKLGPRTLGAAHGRVVNTHPALLPKYGGLGMYGRRVHEAVLKNAEAESGVTVHWVTDEYDAGPIVAQEKVRVLPTDTPETLAERIKAIEKPFYIRIISSLLTRASEPQGAAK